MRQETNNEMDLLLRRLGRRQDVTAPDTAAHLDPDELNAYAENALPPAARARYTEHLAECAPCRELVVQLSAAAGVVSAAQTVNASEPAGWKKFLAGFFSPMVLRYAAPALGLILVAVIGVIMLRRNQSDRYVSQVQNPQSQRAAEAVSPAPEGGLVGSVTKHDQSNPAEETKPTKPASAASPTPQSTAAAVNQTAAAAKPESQPEVARAAEPPAPKAPVAADEKQQKSEDAARQKEAEIKVAPAEVSKQSFELGKGDKRAEEPATVRGRAAKNKSVAGDSVSGLQSAGVTAAQPGAAGGRDDKDSSAETRSVSGRRFRKQRGIWVDTAYDSSRDTVNLTRGSEYYRGLIADEPGIKTIAEQLDGEIIVVWKGRAYRIR